MEQDDGTDPAKKILPKRKLRVLKNVPEKGFRRCRKCRSINPSTAETCGNCGSDIRPPVAEVPSDAKPEPAQEPAASNDSGKEKSST